MSNKKKLALINTLYYTVWWAVGAIQIPKEKHSNEFRMRHDEYSNKHIIKSNHDDRIMSVMTHFNTTNLEEKLQGTCSRCYNCRDSRHTTQLISLDKWEFNFDSLHRRISMGTT